MRWFSSSSVPVSLPVPSGLTNPSPKPSLWQAVLPWSGSPLWRRLETLALGLHILSLFFGLAGLLWVVPHPEWIASLPPIGIQAFSLSMGNGGVAYMVFGMLAAALMGSRLLGWRRMLMFLIPAVGISLGSELLGTSTGIPFGNYGYLSGLGYKIAGLVPFTIPLSWFYVGLSAYLLARVALQHQRHWLLHFEAIMLGALLLTAWDFVLDPAMTRGLIPFWTWFQPGPFFGMPLQNFGGWMLTGAAFMTVAKLLWGKDQPILNRSQLLGPLVLYGANFGFALLMSLGSGIVAPAGLGVLLGLAPALGMWWMAQPAPDLPVDAEANPADSAWDTLEDPSLVGVK
ncbi:carotenoid biosynthesis protein [Synechococcus sp. Nb3U1]|uniref:carotenoid biosynthesis protein n=1 Tax=Synechococcus sp. Nb3U1 TaxID=1914529 RepID=UPI001F2689D2|nr:carotenoid biosynthesis protein [Synechococcus sp. Nb3U1]MCF2971102.1 carotenoid biosynthesis protein [Synechococcus sp. Nb3U1]